MKPIAATLAILASVLVTARRLPSDPPVSSINTLSDSSHHLHHSQSAVPVTPRHPWLVSPAGTVAAMDGRLHRVVRGPNARGRDDKLSAGDGALRRLEGIESHLTIYASRTTSDSVSIQSSGSDRLGCLVGRRI